MPAELTYRAATGLGRALLGALDLAVRAEGTALVPRTGPVLLACNHVSFPDFVWVARALQGRRRVRFLCRADVFDAGVGPAMRAMGHVPVDRAAPAAAYLHARRLLCAGEAVCLFPEAGISAAYVVRALMPGAVALARETGVPLLPVTTWGGARLWGQRRSLDEPLPRPLPTRHRVVDVRFHPPLRVAPADDVVATTRRLGHLLQADLEALQRRPEHQPEPGEPDPWLPAHLGGSALERTASFALDGMPRGAVPPSWGPGAPLAPR